MNNYKLIKLEQGYIIVSNKKIEDNDLLFNIKAKNPELFIKNFKYDSNDVWCKKVIASNFTPELPNIDFNNLEEEFGIINWLNIAIQEEEKEIENNKEYNSTSWYNGFELGFNKCLELNKDKLYTLENIIKAIEMAREGIVINRISEWEIEKEFEYNDSQIIQSLQPKTEWDIDIENLYPTSCCIIKEGETLKNKGCMERNYCKQPKIINNSIKITKKL